MSQAIIECHCRIFVSYQRDDIRGEKGRPYDRLRIAFGLDTDIHPGGGA